MQPFGKRFGLALVFLASACSPASAGAPQSELDVTMVPDTYRAVLAYKDWGKDLYGASRVDLAFGDLATRVPMQRVGRKTWEAALTREQTQALARACKAGGICAGKVVAELAGEHREIAVQLEVGDLAVQDDPPSGPDRPTHSGTEIRSTPPLGGDARKGGI